MKSALLSTLGNSSDEVTEEEILLISIQLFVTVCFIITTFISVLLSYDLLMKKTDRNSLFSDEEASNLDIYNHAIILGLVIIMVFVSNRYVNITKEREEDTTNSKIQFAVSIITLITSILSIYVTLNSSFNFADIENPNV